MGNESFSKVFPDIIIDDDVYDERRKEAIFTGNGDFRNLEHLYDSAIRTLTMRFEILNEEFKVKYERNPIHHIEARIKSPRSIINKLKSRHYEVSLESAKKNLNDIGGVRVVCCYIDDVYSVADMFLNQKDITLLERQDYIKEPNYNGYRSLHLDVSVPVYLSDHTEYVTCEVQLRTVAMDFWASLEHDLRYKTNKQIPEEMGVEMKNAADRIAEIDEEMQALYKKMESL